jgi:G3E family GTPase
MVESIPLTVIGGYLGSGKTTLLNHILKHNQGLRLAIIVNDFGKINIDAALIESQSNTDSGDIINLANGCICCSLSGGLASTLLTLRDRADFIDHVIVEASGVADPHAIAQNGHLPGFRLDGVIVMADAETIRKQSKDKYVGSTVLLQLRNADVIVLNKVDLVTSEQLTDVRDWIYHQAPESRILETSLAQVPLALLMGLHIDGVDPPSDQCNHDHHDDHEHHHTAHFIDYSLWSDTCDIPLNEAAFRNWVEELPKTLLRAKGLLYLLEDPETRYEFQLVGKRWELKRAGSWGTTQRRSQIVAIGLPGTTEPRTITAISLIQIT